MLLDAGADPNITDNDGRTPMRLAYLHRRYDDYVKFFQVTMHLL